MYRLQFAASVPAPGLLLLRCHTEPALLLQGGNQRCACCCLLHGSGILGVLIGAGKGFALQPALNSEDS